MAENKVKRMEMRHMAARDALVKQGLARMLEHPEGRAFLWFVLEVSGLNANPYTGNALQTSYNAGKQEVGQSVLSLIEDVNPYGYVKMLSENIESAEKLKASIEKELSDDPQLFDE